MRHTCPAIQINPPKQVCWGDIIGEIDNQQDLIDKITQMMDVRDEINFNSDNPVGTVVISETERTFRFGTWVLLDEGKYLCATQDANKAGTTTQAGLPNIKGNITGLNARGSAGKDITRTGALTKSQRKSSGAIGCSSLNGDLIGSITFNASDYNNIYSDDVDTVKPYSQNVYMYKRTA